MKLTVPLSRDKYAAIFSDGSTRWVPGHRLVIRVHAVYRGFVIRVQW